MKNLNILLIMFLASIIFGCQEKKNNIIGENTIKDGVDLGIGDDETYKRPNSWSQNKTKLKENESLLATDGQGAASRPGVSIAWRNATQIEEVEIRVRNLGNKPGEGKPSVDILGESGEVLLHLTPPDEQEIISIPAADRGGLEGKIIRMKASRSLNNLIDRYDRMKLRYHVKATIETIGEDLNPFDNSKTKTWNSSFTVRPEYLNTFNYTYKNHSDSAVVVKWLFEHTPYPKDWEVDGVPSETNSFTLKPGEEIKGFLTMKAPKVIEENAFLESRLSLVDEKSNKVFQQQEWFQVYDTKPPHVSNYRLVETSDNRIGIQVLASDMGSGILEATGVTTEFSTDGGRTWATVAHNYKNGNFVRPTLFEAFLGPFNDNTNLQLRLTVKDTWGNCQTIIPSDATAMIAPPAADTLLSKAYIFPRTMANKIFDMDFTTAAHTDMKFMNTEYDKLLNMSTLEYNIKKK
jgi:hypothetical protein